MLRDGYYTLVYLSVCAESGILHRKSVRENLCSERRIGLLLRPRLTPRRSVSKLTFLGLFLFCIQLFFVQSVYQVQAIPLTSGNHFCRPPQA